MKQRAYTVSIFFAFLVFFSPHAPLNGSSGDWPIYKGNIYFTGNNDEIIIKNSNLKWLFQGDAHLYNPVISDGYVYFIDGKGRLYSVNEENGRLRWKVSVKKISRVFRSFSRAAGKVKYPLVKGNRVFLSDPIAIYAFDKATGRVIWARTGMRREKQSFTGPAGYRSLPMVDGIYANPLIHKDKIIYGTRNMFLSREIRNGHEAWENRGVKTYSAFPTFYDRYIITQSMNYRTGKYTIHFIDGSSGKEKWTSVIAKPFKIFAPVIYGGKVYVTSGSKIYCLDKETGKNLWMKDIERVISSQVAATDRSLLFIVDNSDIAVFNTVSRKLDRTIPVGKKAGPYYVLVRDQMYIAYNRVKTVNGRRVVYGGVRAVNFSDASTLWEYQAPFPGSVGQPSAAGGILFLPAGNYLYAIGTEYYEKVIDGGSGYAVTPGKRGNKLPPPQRPDYRRKKIPPLAMKKLKLRLKDERGRPLNGDAEIKFRKKGKIIFHQKKRIKGEGSLLLPREDGVEVILDAPGYMPQKLVIRKKDKKKEVTLRKIRRNKNFIVRNILFELNKAYLKKESLDIIDRLVKIMKSNSQLKVEVQGYTDSTGSAAHNQKLSERRADAVVAYMIKSGISPERVKAVGFGEKKPVADNKTPSGRRKNRRTEFVFK